VGFHLRISLQHEELPRADSRVQVFEQLGGVRIVRAFCSKERFRRSQFFLLQRGSVDFPPARGVPRPHGVRRTGHSAQITSLMAERMFSLPKSSRSAGIDSAMVDLHAESPRSTDR
jgi:hypothetical protein